MSLRTHNSHIKSLLHFNYPYYAEPGDGLTDDIGIFSWTRSGSAKLAGSEIPADLIISETPKFGYRCLHTDSNSDYITGTRVESLSYSQLEVSLWLRVSASSSGNILQLKNANSVVLLLTVGSDLKLTASSSSLGFSVTSGGSLSLNTWTYIRLQVSASEAKISLNNSAGSSVTFNESTLPAFNAITLGGLHGEIDEFTLRDSFTDTLPSEPTQAVCNVNALGGFGDGRLGDVTAQSSGIMNSTAMFIGTKTSSGYAISDQITGMYGVLKAGDEVMLWNMSTGEYCFRTITSKSGSYVKLNSDPTSSFLTGNNNVQIVQIPNFNTRSEEQESSRKTFLLY